MPGKFEKKGIPTGPFWNPAAFPVYWIGLSIAVATLDFLLGPSIQFPIVFVVPVALAAWFSGWRWGLSLAVLLPLIRLYFVTLWDSPWEFGHSVANAVIRVLVLGGIAIILHLLAESTRQLEQRVKTLEGILPICSGCKKIRNEEGEWEPVEVYISRRTRAEFTHGLCPPCQHDYFGEVVHEGNGPHPEGIRGR